MPDLSEARVAEFPKYLRAYELEAYRLKDKRRKCATKHLQTLPVRGRYLDVSTGRGEMLDVATTLGFAPVRGTEIVPHLIDGQRVIYAEAHNLPFPDKSFDVATLFDVIEHLIPGDDELACRELARVARHHVLISASNLESHNHFGDDLHINKRQYHDWNRLFCEWFPGARVMWLTTRPRASEIWRIDL